MDFISAHIHIKPQDWTQRLPKAIYQPTTRATRLAYRSPYPTPHHPRASITTFCKGTRAARKASTCRVYMAACAAVSWWRGDTSRSAQRRLYRASWQIALQSGFSCTSSWGNMIDDLHRHLYPFSPPIAEILCGREKLAVKTHLSTFLQTPLRAFCANEVCEHVTQRRALPYCFFKEMTAWKMWHRIHRRTLKEGTQTARQSKKTTAQLRQKTASGAFVSILTVWTAARRTTSFENRAREPSILTMPP